MKTTTKRNARKPWLNDPAFQAQCDAANARYAATDAKFKAEFTEEASIGFVLLHTICLGVAIPLPTVLRTY